MILLKERIALNNNNPIYLKKKDQLAPEIEDMIKVTMNKL